MTGRKSAVSLAKFLLGAVLFTCGLGQATSAEPAATGKPAGKMRLGYLAGVPLIPREKLFGNPDKASPRVSPDGRSLAYLAPDEGVLNVWVGPVDKPEAARPVTHDRRRGIRTFFWTYTNRQILYLQDSGGNENFHVYRVDLDTTIDLNRQGHVRGRRTSKRRKSRGSATKPPISRRWKTCERRSSRSAIASRGRFSWARTIAMRKSTTSIASTWRRVTASWCKRTLSTLPSGSPTSTSASASAPNSTRTGTPCSCSPMVKGVGRPS